MLCAGAYAQQDTSQGAVPHSITPIKPGPDSTTCAQPLYPSEARRLDQQGTVTLLFLIGTNGAVNASKIVKSSGFALLDRAANNDIVSCKFTATMVDGQPVQSWMQIEYVWKLGGGAGPVRAAAEPAH